MGQLEGDAGDARDAGTSTVTGARWSSGSCGGGPLPGALEALAAELETRTAAMGAALSGASVALAGNAATYRRTDESAAVLFGDTFGSG